MVFFIKVKFRQTTILFIFKKKLHVKDLQLGQKICTWISAKKEVQIYGKCKDVNTEIALRFPRQPNGMAGTDGDWSQK